MIDYKTLVLAFKHLFLVHDFILLQLVFLGREGIFMVPFPHACSMQPYHLRHMQCKNPHTSELTGWLDQNVLYIHFTVT